MPDKSITFQSPFTGRDIESRMVYGYASTGAVDSHGTVFEPSWWPNAIQAYLQDRSISALHTTPNVGFAPILEATERGLWIGARVEDNDVWTNVASGKWNGFSIRAVPLSREERLIDGKKVQYFPRFVLLDITIGPLPSNEEAVHQLVERLQIAGAEESWSFTEQDADNIVAAFGMNGLAAASLYKNPSGDPEDRSTYKLPIAKVQNGQLTVFLRGAQAASAVLNGGRPDEAYTEEERRVIHERLKSVYRLFGIEAPELRLSQTGGSEMSKFAEEVSKLFKKVTGKDPNEDQKKEIAEAEERLKTDQDKQIDELNTTIGKMEDRLQAMEKEDQKSDDKDPMKPVNDSLKKFEKRLEAIERLSGRSRQPGDGGGGGDDTGGRKPKVGMNNFLRGASGRKVLVDE